MNRRGETGYIGQHQLAHVLASHADDLCGIGQANQVGGYLDKHCRWKGFAHICQRTFHGILCTSGFASELQCQSARLPNPNQGIITACLTQALNQRIPMGRMGTGDDIGAAVAYLASREAEYVTGHTLHVNGGMAMFA